MFNTENLLRNEVFPAELPPCFSTDDLAANATLAIATSNSFGQGYSIPLTYSGYKSESSRRKFALPNPYHYCKAVDFIVKNESQIKAILEKSKYSLTAPIERQPRQKQPYAKRSNTVLDTKREIECLFQENRIVVRNGRPCRYSDRGIISFYHAIAIIMVEKCQKPKIRKREISRVLN